MNPEQQKSILAIALFAAFADGAKHDREREEIRRIAESLGGAAGAPDLAGLYQDVLLKRLSLGTAAAALQDPGERQLAYEMAVCVCDADGRQSEAEQRFLDELKALLKLDAGQTAAFERDADVIVELSEAAAPAVPGAVVAAQPNVSEAELDKSILNYALMNGALELLPQSWASMAIIPLQIKMVYGIGRAHGVSLDQGQQGKEAVIAPVLGGALGWRVERVSGFDTGTLGIFTRDIPRAGTQLEAARRKARIGMKRSGLPLGLANEGALALTRWPVCFPETSSCCCSSTMCAASR